MNIEQAKNIQIRDYLSYLGLEPKNTNGGVELHYLAYYRNDTNPSLDVNINKNIWIDRAEGIGGDLIDLIKREKNCDTSQALLHIETIFSFLPAKKKKVEIEIKEANSNKITSIGNLWNPHLLEYANSRKISTQKIKEETKEITYKNSFGTFKAIGFINEKNGWDLRADKFKAKMDTNYFSLRYPGKKSIIVVEGFFDYLSVLEFSEKPYQYSYLILNSTTNLERSLEILETYNCIWLALDNDETGNKATKLLISKLKKVKDLREKYKKFNDLNDYLISLRN